MAIDPNQERDSQQTRELAHLLLDAQMAKEAVGVFEQLSEQNPDDSRIYHQLAVAQLMAGRLRDGIRNCRRALRIDPGYTLAMHNLVIAHMELRELGRARYWLRRAMETAGDEPRLRRLQTRLGWLRVRKLLRTLVGW